MNPDTITIEVSDEKVVLSGTVPTHTARISVFEAALFTAGVDRIENNITVQHSSKQQETANEEEINDFVILIALLAIIYDINLTEIIDNARAGTGIAPFREIIDKNPLTGAPADAPFLKLFLN